VDPPATAGRQADRGSYGLARVLAVLEGDKHGLVLDLVLDRRLGQDHLVGLGQGQPLAAAVEDICRDADHQPDRPG
jgi:hypothetical protein